MSAMWSSLSSSTAAPWRFSNLWPAAANNSLPQPFSNNAGDISEPALIQFFDVTGIVVPARWG
jgi:hypothetical protein